MKRNGDVYDIVIVGAGPAGLSTAEVAARLGAKVFVLEKNSKIGVPIRTSGGSWIKYLDTLGTPHLLYHPVRKVRFISPHKEAIFEWKSPVFCALNVSGFYQFLAKKAVLAGAKIKLNSRVTKPILEDSYLVGVSYEDKNGPKKVGARLIIDASGSSAIIAREIGLYGKLKRFAVGVEYEFFAPYYHEDETILAVGNKIAPSGYGWAFPCGKKQVRVGVGIIRPDSLASPSKCLDYFLKQPYLKSGLKGAKKLEVHSGVIPSDGVRKSFIYNGLMVIGDAANQASPLVGEGIRYAIESGKIAGRIAAQAVFSKNTSKNFLYRYECEWREKFGKTMSFAFELNKEMASYKDKDWDEKTVLLSKLTAGQMAQLLKSNFSPFLAISIFIMNPSLIKKIPSLLRYIKKAIYKKGAQSAMGKVFPAMKLMA